VFARIYCIGSPLVWWLAAAAPTVFLARALSTLLGISLPLPAVSTASETTDARLSANGWLLLAGYFVNWLPFILVERVAFLYHFLPSLLLSLLLLGVVFDSVVPSTLDLTSRDLSTTSEPPSQWARLSPVLELAAIPDAPRWLALGLIIYAFATAYAFFAPLAYGNPLTSEELQARMWLKGWA